MAVHVPVLLQEVLKFLEPKSGENFIDATCGEGGYTQKILEAILPQGKVLAIDWNIEAINEIRRNLVSKNLVAVCGNFKELDALASDSGIKKIQGIVYDLGLSKFLLEKSQRGFSFQKDEPLMMSFAKDAEVTAASIVNHAPLSELENIFRDYGEERFAKRIARMIVESRPFGSSRALGDAIAGIMPRRGKIHPATKVFQALRIAVNNEFSNLETSLVKAMDLIEAGGRIVVVSYHSLEDGIAKNVFRNFARHKEGEVLTKKPVTASSEEISLNPSARSAKLRVIKKLTNRK